MTERLDEIRARLNDGYYNDGEDPYPLGISVPDDIAFLFAEIDRLSATCGMLLWPGRDHQGPCILPVDHLAGHRSLRPDGQPVGWSTASLAAIIGLTGK